MKKRPMIRKPEILAPAGAPESIPAAVRAGADAVYLGVRRFSARAGAGNFDAGDLAAAVRYCHARGVRVYLALNTLLTDSELPDALRVAQAACALPVDAVLVQDMGLARLLRSRAPRLRLHASTQTGVHTAAGAKALCRAGFRRVVLARELSLPEVAAIHRACPIELEVFVHGAQCMSVSGQCYFSAVLGSRSGNRGQCAQPCRLPFSAPGGTGHDLSLKDLSLISRAEELARAGAVSLKIEGRLKRPEYVAAAARACRLSVDGRPVPRWLADGLRAAFSRSGFTSGYADGRRGRAMFGVRSRQDARAATSGVLRSLRRLYASELEKIPVDFALEVLPAKPVALSAEDAEGNRVRAAGELPRPAMNLPVKEARCAKQLEKTGGTPFFARRISCRIGEKLAVPVSELNRLRREALEGLERARGSAVPPVPFRAEAVPAPQEHRAGPFRLRARFAGTRLPRAARRCELVYVPCTADPHRLSELLAEGFPVGVELPRGLFGLEDAARRRLELARAAGVTDVWAGNLDGVRLALDAGMRVHGGFSLNIFNTAALEWYGSLGLADTELSFELKLSQAAYLGGGLPRGLLLYGRLPLMLCRCCPAANSAQGCLHCQTPPELTDRRGVRFPIQCFGACSEVLNSVPLYLADRLDDVKNQDFGVLRFSTESTEEAERILEIFLAAAAGERAPVYAGNFTRGLYYRGVL